MKVGQQEINQLMMLVHNSVWKREYPPRKRGEGVVVNFFNMGEETASGTYRGITLLDTVGKVL